MLVKKYSPDCHSQWNEFILNSKQGTFLFNREYMDYHADRFEDKSLLFYNEKNKLIAVLPANIKDNILYSHQGLSYGGLIYTHDAKTIEIINCFEAIYSYAQQAGIEKIIYKRVPYIYHSYLADEDLYALFKSNYHLFRRDIGYVLNLSNPLRWNELRKRCLKKAFINPLSVKETEDYDSYYNLLCEVLLSHDVKPVHSSEEMKLLSRHFPKNIKLICTYHNDVIVSGVWLFIEKDVIHAQYIATSEDGKKVGGFEILIDHLQKKYSDKAYLSFGISTEQNGLILNEGLAQQKESFGARGVAHDFYELNLTY